MRLLSLTLRNYRVHKELCVHFDPTRNLIGGPNESGKSTLAEAAHRALFLRAKTGGKIQKEMVSSCHLGEPEVLLTFEAAGHAWELEKRFAGSKGSTRLTRRGSTPLKDEEAETHLADLLKFEITSGGSAAKLLPTLWSHLWVWQGSSGEDPSGHASAHKDTLVQRLQQDGLAAVMQSATDQRVRERLTADYDELFTATGKPKAGSKPELARSGLVEAEAALARTLEITRRLEQAAAEHERAGQEIAAAEAILPSLYQQKTATETTLAEVGKLRNHEESQCHAWQTAASQVKQLAENDIRILQLHQQAIASREALVPAERLEASFLAAEKEARELSQIAEIAHRQAADSVRGTRLHDDLAGASITAFEKFNEHQRLAACNIEADQLRAEITRHHESLAQFPDLNAKQLEALRSLDRAAQQASIRLLAMAASIELLTADFAVTLDGQPFAPGELRTLTDAGELRVGLGTRLCIRPGGGSSLAEARLQRENSQRALTTALDCHTLRDLDHATAVLEQRQWLTQQIAQLETRWKALGGESLAAELAAAATAFEVAKPEVQRRLVAFDSSTAPPADLDAARELRAVLRQKLEQAEETEITALRQSDQTRSRFATATTNLQSHRDQTAQAHQALRDLTTKLEVLQQSHGDTPAREKSLLDLRVAEQQTATLLATTRAALAALVPDLLVADLDRFNRAIAQQETRRREAEKLGAIALDRLTLDGSIDPHAELSHAQARHAAALGTHLSQQRHAKALALLKQLFGSSREAIDRSLVQPLADRISGYLQCLFGPAAQVRVNLSDDGMVSLELCRADDSSFQFQTLSGGAKEQVAAAARLAMAEILATDHEGCLPLVFDDAFAYTDPIRVQSLQRMLNLAALRGLQVIVFTCTPDDYSAFGAKEYRLS